MDQHRVIFLVGFLLLSFRFTLIAQELPIKRSGEPVVVTGDALAPLIGIAPADIVAFRYDGTAWIQIPVQVDERDYVDAHTIYGDTPVEEFLQPNWGTNLDSLVILTYTDTNTFTGPDRDLLFDDNDELLFMARDAGFRMSGSQVPGAVAAAPKVEVRIADPLSGDVGYVYLFRQTGNLVPSAGKKYVDYRFNLLSGDYKETYTIGSYFDPEDSYVTTPYYQQHFSDRWVRDGLRIYAEGASGKDILDRHKTLLEPNNCGRSEEVFSSQEGAMVTYKSGPIRAIRSYFGANSGPLNQREHKFYEQSDEVVFELRMHSIRGIMDFMDYSAEAIGMKYRNNNNTEGVIIDGVPEELNEGKIFWEQTTGTQGTWISFSQLRHNFDVPADLETYYEDNVDPVDIQCTGDEHAYGAVGHLIPIRIPLTDPRGETPNWLNMTRHSYFAGPDKNKVSDVLALQEERRNPLSICTANCDEVPVSPSNLHATAIDFNKITLAWSDNSTNETGFVIERLTEDELAFTTIGTIAPDSEHFTDVTVRENTDYTYRIKAVNGGFSSTYSSILEIKTTRDLDAAPSDLKITGRTSSSIELSWQDNTDDETNFSLERTLGGAEDFEVVAILSPNVTTHTDEGLQPNTQYSYRVRALRPTGNTMFSNLLHTKTAEAVPDAPSNFEVIARSGSVLVFRWQDNSNNEEGFVLERAIEGEGTFSFVDTLGRGTVTYTDIDLISTAVYIYRLKAFNQVGSSAYTSLLRIRTSANVPEGPSSLTGSRVAEDAIQLRWQDNATNETGFVLEREKLGQSEEAPVTIILEEEGLTAYLDKDITPGVSYRYRMKAYNNEGDSPYSNIISVGLVLGVNDAELLNALKLYPNPAEHTVNLQLLHEKSGPVQVRIMDAIGNGVLRWEFSKLQRVMIQPLPIHDLSGGIYFVEVQFDGKRVVSRIIKQ